MNDARLDDLQRFWDETVAGGTASPGTLDPALAATIRRLHTLRDVPALDRSYAARLRQDLLASPASPRDLDITSPGSRNGRGVLVPWPVTLPAFAPPGRDDPGRIGRPRFPLSAPRRHWMMAQVSLAALVIVMLGGVWLTVGRNAGDYASGSTDIVVELTGPVPGMADGGTVVLRRVTLDPGAFYTDIRNGPSVILVESGRHSYKSLLDGIERTLGPGDTATATATSTLIITNESANAGSVLIAQVLPGDSDMWTPFLNDGVRVDNLTAHPLGRDFDTATLSLRQSTVAPGGRLATWQTSGLAWIAVTRGKLGLTLDGKELPYRFEPGVEREQVRGTTSILDGVTVGARNRGDTSLVLTIVTIDPSNEVATPPP